MGIEAKPSENLEMMIRFLASNSGIVRFDHYMQEHLYSQDGYYSKNARIGSGDFGTEAFRPEFAHLIFLNLQQDSLDGKGFLELGGGTGVFKGNYLKCSPETKYLSADISKKFALMQAQAGGSSVVGDAAALGLQNNSIDGVIFSNELIDNLPCRVFRITRDDNGVRINEEGYMLTDGKALYFEFKEAERDEFLETYEKFLNQGIYPVANGDIISAAPKAVDVIKESLRVLKSGKIMFIDYGFGEVVRCEREPQEMPHIMGSPDYDSSADMSKILASPYQTDITYSVDFEFLKWIARQIDPNVQVNYKSQVNLLSVVPEFHQCIPIPKPYDHFDWVSHFLVLGIDKHAPSHH